METLKNGFHIQSVFFKNPFVIMSQPTPLTFPSGRVGPKLLMYYKRLTSLEPAIVMTGPASVVAPRSRNYSLLRADQPKYFEGIKALTKIISVNGAMAGVQLTIPPPLMNPLEWYRSPSIDQFSLEDYPPSEKVLQLFTKAISRCMQSGFVYIEIDMSHKMGLDLFWREGNYSLIKSLFEQCRKSMKNQAILGLAIESELPRSNELIHTFLQSGGDLIAFEDPHISHLIPVENSLQIHLNPSYSSNLFKPLDKARLTGLRPDDLFAMVG